MCRRKPKNCPSPLMHGCWKQDGGSVMTWEDREEGTKRTSVSQETREHRVSPALAGTPRSCVKMGSGSYVCRTCLYIYRRALLILSVSMGRSVSLSLGAHVASHRALVPAPRGTLGGRYRHLRIHRVTRGCFPDDCPKLHSHQQCVRQTHVHFSA